MSASAPILTARIAGLVVRSDLDGFGELQKR